jgi:hypothetical protein
LFATQGWIVAGGNQVPSNVSDEQSLAVALARHAVRQVAPQEMPLFRANSKAFLKDPTKAFQPKQSGDDPLGFGAGAEALLLTPAVLAVASEVAKFVISEITKATVKHTASGASETIGRLVARIGRGEPTPSGPPPLTRQQLAEVREVAYATAVRLLVSEDQAQLLADSTVGALALT